MKVNPSTFVAIFMNETTDITTKFYLSIVLSYGEEWSIKEWFLAFKKW